jgi:drug/metabolite transporter (DMT)-like permease
MSLAGVRRRFAPGVAEMAGATLLWGATFIVIRDTVARVDPVALVFTRFAIAAPLLFGLAFAARRRFTPAAWVGGGIAGVVAAIAFTLQAAGLRTTTAGTSAFLTSLGSLFAGLFAWPLLRQRPGQRLVWGMGLAAVGTALLTGVRGLQLGEGEVLTIAGAVTFAFQIVVLARFAPEADPLALAAVQALALAATAAPFAMTRLDAALFSHALGGRLAYLVLAGSVVAPVLQVMAQRTLSAGRTGLLLGLEPVFAAGFAVMLGGEHPPTQWWAGAGLILAAVWLVESRASRA